ncbi:hypothetical protein ACQ4M3_40555 [Leptolyngbya sp. AN03gr2]|uniref:hypothetical protein n=1 Tax=unclassified Leptolyngbya TaxID=2650499 RepID=UPI003D3144D6
MSLPVSDSSGKREPIEVTKNDTHFLVRIHLDNRERAKSIPSWRWDGDRKVWVTALAIYDALVAEFRKDADCFDIRRPKTLWLIRRSRINALTFNAKQRTNPSSPHDAASVHQGAWVHRSQSFG